MDMTKLEDKEKPEQQEQAEPEHKEPAGDEKFPIMPLRNTVLFPQQIIPIYIGREQSLKLIDDLPSGRKMLVVVAQKDGS
ncbi:unnamed protein product, partial [marine sediment metagenome]